MIFRTREYKYWCKQAAGRCALPYGFACLKSLVVPLLRGGLSVPAWWFVGAGRTFAYRQKFFRLQVKDVTPVGKTCYAYRRIQTRHRGMAMPNLLRRKKNKRICFVLRSTFRNFAIKEMANLLLLGKKKKQVSLFCARLFVTLQAKQA